MGIAADRLLICGSVQYDRLPLDLSESEVRHFCREHHLPTEGILFVCPMLPLPQHRSYSSKILGSEALDLYLYIHHLAEMHSQCAFVIKCRNQEEMDYFRNAALPLKNMYLTDTRENSYLYARARGLITYYSTMIIEALAFQTPSIVANFSQEYPVAPLAEYQVALESSSQAQLDSYVMDFIEQGEFFQKCLKNRQAFLDDYVYKQDGHSAKRVLQRAMSSDLVYFSQ